MSHAGVQEAIDALTGGHEVSPALTEIMYCIIAGQGEGFTEAGVLRVDSPNGLVLELMDGTRWAVGVLQVRVKP